MVIAPPTTSPLSQHFDLSFLPSLLPAPFYSPLPPPSSLPSPFPLSFHPSPLPPPCLVPSTMSQSLDISRPSCTMPLFYDPSGCHSNALNVTITTVNDTLYPTNYIFHLTTSLGTNLTAPPQQATPLKQATPLQPACLATSSCNCPLPWPRLLLHRFPPLPTSPFQ